MSFGGLSRRGAKKSQTTTTTTTTLLLLLLPRRHGHVAGLTATARIACAAAGSAPANIHPRRKMTTPNFLSNVGAAYNLAVVGLVVAALESGFAPGAVDPWHKAMVGSAGMVGAASGQLLMGFLGDVVGRVPALVLTTLVVVIGALMSAALPHGSPSQVFETLAVCRLVTGFGVGGVYPLTATTSMEERHRASFFTPIGRTLLVFSGQGWGQLLAPVVVYLLAPEVGIPTEGSSGNSTAKAPAANGPPLVQDDTTWRAALGIGAIPSLLAVTITLVRAWRERNSVLEPEDVIIALAGDHPDNVSTRAARGIATRIPLPPTTTSDAADDLAGETVAHNPSRATRLCSALADSRNLKRLVGTGGSWFLFDVCFYANVVFSSLVLERVFGRDEGAGARAIAGPTALTFLVALPGYYIAVFVAERVGLRRLQIFTFVALAFVYLVAAAANAALPPSGLFVLYALTFLIANAGPNSTTFCLPAKTFPKDGRSTLSGVSAALGKLGAVVGTVSYPYVLDATQGRIWGALLLSAGVSVLGAIVTYWAVDADFEVVQALRSRRVAADSTSTSTPAEGDANGGGTSFEMTPLARVAAFSSSAARRAERIARGLPNDDANPFVAYARMGIGSAAALGDEVEERLGWGATRMGASGSGGGETDPFSAAQLGLDATPLSATEDESFPALNNQPARASTNTGTSTSTDERLLSLS